MIYVMSDIHGQLTALEEILEKIHFTKDDFIYFLGDYVDWGKDSIGVIKKCMELEKQGQAKCLLGNHDLFFLEQIEYENELLKNGLSVELNLNSMDWMQNKGQETYDAYCKLSSEEKQELYEWLDSLNYTCECSLNGKEYLLCHSTPQMQLDKNDKNYCKNRHNAVWYRDYTYFPSDIVIKTINGDNGFQLTKDANPKIYDCYIHGHTINKNYLPDGKYGVYDEVKITNEEISMDCGAKCIGYTDNNPNWKCYNLACLNLNTMEIIHSFAETKQPNIVKDECDLEI